MFARGTSGAPLGEPARPDGGRVGAAVGAARPGSGALALPTISRRTGGGAIRGIGEKLSANPVTGTGAMSVPIATSPGRSGFGPQLTLTYDSGRGNGAFGFGWSVSLPEVSRKVDQGVPRYDDAEADVYLISDAEDLVPVRDPGSDWARVSRVESGYRIDLYRPRVEGLFARIERWTRLSDGDTHWRSTTRDNVTTWYGEDGDARIADPADPRRVFRWLISRSCDDKGNALVYEYVADDGDGVDTAAAHERHRTSPVRATNRYLKRIRYGNRVSRLTDPSLGNAGWMFEAVFDYGDHDPDRPVPAPDRPWPCRTDPFSSYRSGFEVRTYRLCQRVLMFHHFPDAPGVGADCLVRSTVFSYVPGPAVGMFLTAVTQSGHRRAGDGYLTRSLPPVEFGYSPAELRGDVHEIDAASVAGAPAGLAGAGQQWVDLDGDGISGILAEQGAGWFYKPNLGGGRFGPPRPVAPLPSIVDGVGTRLLDLAGDGRLDVATLDGPLPGFFERGEHGAGWGQFVPFASLPAVDWEDANLRLVDVDGDGHADVLLTEDEAITWYPSLGEAGFGPARRVTVPLDERGGPRVVFADSAGSIHLADMSGDGLTDLVRIGNGQVCYWPNLGHGRFGAKVTMDDAPRFDRDELFDPRYLRLADVDGSGVVDIVYLGHDGARIYLNRGGNAWGPAHLVATAPRTDSRAHVSTVDLFGTGTTCLVWSSDRPEDARRSVRYIDLLGSAKPHLLVRVDNNLGAETHVRYAPSTYFYLADKSAGRPWLTRLPFPVHVVERVETHDRISRNRFVTRYAYHHGYFDGEEREFRGFGMVEQWDTEELTALGGSLDPSGDEAGDPSGDDPGDQSGDEAGSHVPPVLTRTWFHTGRPADAGALARQFEAEYWREPGLTADQERALLLDDTASPDTVRLPDGAALPHRPTDAEFREACRALKGLILRQETYALDGSAAAGRPYQVTEHGYTVELLQPRRDDDRHAVYLTYTRESITYHYERALYEVPGAGAVADPRGSHEVTLDVNGHGDVLRSVSVGYGRRHPDADTEPRLAPWAQAAVRDEQTRLRAMLTVNGYTNAVDVGPDYRAPLPCESRRYELVGLAPADPTVPVRFHPAQLRAAAGAATDLSYEDITGAGAVGPGPWRRLIEHTRTYFRRDDLTGLLPLGRLEPLALPGERLQLALTPGLVAAAYGDRVNAELLGEEGGYVHSEGDDNWWIPSGRVFGSPGAADDAASELAHARAHFFLPHRLRDPFGATTTAGYDHDLLVAHVTDAAGNTVSAENDLRVLLPVVVTDANGNRTAAAFDALGLLVGTAVMGKPGEPVGDSLAGFAPDLDPAAVAGHHHDPLADPGALLGRATSRIAYDIDAYRRTRDDPQPRPAAVATLTRDVHDADLGPGEQAGIQHSLGYFDGFGREIQRKALAEPGPVVEGGPALDPRWVGSGWTVFNNKGLPVREYEPFFTATPAFELARAEGVSPIRCYDPVGRVVAVLYPNHSWEKVCFDPWRQQAWDTHDTASVGDPRGDPDVGGLFDRLPTASYLPTWLQARQSGALGAAEQDAAAKVATHAATPSTAYLDGLGRAALSAVHNRFERDGATVEEISATRTELDVAGRPLAVTDPHGRLAVQHMLRAAGPGTVAATGYDAAGALLYQCTIDAGERRRLDNVAGNRIRSWDDRGQVVRTRYDALQRAVETWVRDRVEERLAVRTEYGEAQGPAGNHRGRVFRRRDAAGIVTHEAYDFAGNLLRTSQRLLADYRAEADWSATPVLDAEVFTATTAFDALNRPVTRTTPDGSVTRSSYNEAGRLERVDARVRGGPEVTSVVTAISYNAKGQRLTVHYGNGVQAAHEYDPLTARLSRILARRGGESLRDLRYTHDPSGNITSVRDEAQQTVYFDNAVVEPHADYGYDATYRLIRAAGREHRGQVGRQHSTWDNDGRVRLPHPHDGQAMRRYTQRYDYDEVGNLLRVAHQAAGDGWTRDYGYAEPSVLDPGQASNRLSRTTVGALIEPYTYDAHGNVTSMPHLARLDWDSFDRLRRVDLGGGGTAWYCYDADGRRVRKVVERQNGTRHTQRLYFGELELFQEYSGDGDGLVLQRETLHLMADGGRVAQVESRVRGDDGSPARLVRYRLGNQLGSTTVELDEAGRIISYEEYYPFGGAAFQAVRSQVEAPNRYRLTGNERDEETGFTYHEVRYYAPWLGRWTRPDPAGLVDGPAVYSYARNNPVNLRDPAGRAAAPPTDVDAPDEDEPPAVTPHQAHIEESEAEAKKQRGGISKEEQAIYDEMRKSMEHTKWKELPKADGLDPRRPGRQFGLAEVIDAVVEVAAEFEKRHPGYTVRVLDIGREGGGSLKPHKSHQRGIDVDVGVVLKDVKMNNSGRRVSFRDETRYSRELTQELINLFHSNSVLGVDIIWFADPKVETRAPWAKPRDKLSDDDLNHTKHFHVRFLDPLGRTAPSRGRSTGSRRAEPLDRSYTGPLEPEPAGPPARAGQNTATGPEQQWQVDPRDPRAYRGPLAVPWRP